MFWNYKTGLLFILPFVVLAILLKTLRNIAGSGFIIVLIAMFVKIIYDEKSKK